MAASVSGYRKALDRIASESAAKAVEAARKLDLSSPAARAALKDAMAAAGNVSASAAAGVSARFYSAMSEAQTGETFAAVVHSGYTRGKTDEAVAALLSAFDETGDVEALMTGLADHIDSCTRMGARGCMGANGRADPREPRWASVPSSSRACDYCTQIAAAGFYAKNPVQPIHDHCKCSSVPGWNGKMSKAGGYDPRKWEERYETNKLLKSYGISPRQFGGKIGKHVKDFGFTPDELSDPAVRRAIAEKIGSIINSPDERVTGVMWRAQIGLCTAYVKDGLVALVDSDGMFVTSFKEAPGGNKRINSARASRR